MVSPAKRRACRVPGTSRSIMRRGLPPLRTADDVLRAGCARCRARTAYEVNHKRVARLCREEGRRVRGKAASADGWAPRPHRGTGWPPSGPTTCGRWTTSSTPLPADQAAQHRRRVHTRGPRCRRGPGDRHRRDRARTEGPGGLARHSAGLPADGPRLGVDPRGAAQVVPLHRRGHLIQRPRRALANG